MRGLWIAREQQRREREERAFVDLAVQLGMTSDDRNLFLSLVREKNEFNFNDARTKFETLIQNGVRMFPANARAIADEAAQKPEFDRN